jgi:hypothetical protein
MATYITPAPITEPIGTKGVWGAWLTNVATALLGVTDTGFVDNTRVTYMIKAIGGIMLLTGTCKSYKEDYVLSVNLPAPLRIDSQLIVDGVATKINKGTASISIPITSNTQVFTLSSFV